MSCAGCRADNAAHRRYCGQCGAALLRTCGQCAFTNVATDAFCGGCGGTLAEPASRTAPAVTVREAPAPPAKQGSGVRVLTATEIQDLFVSPHVDKAPAQNGPVSQAELDSLFGSGS